MHVNSWITMVVRFSPFHSVQISKGTYEKACPQCHAEQWKWLNKTWIQFCIRSDYIQSQSKHVKKLHVSCDTKWYKYGKWSLFLRLKDAQFLGKKIISACCKALQTFVIRESGGVEEDSHWSATLSPMDSRVCMLEVSIHLQEQRKLIN